MEQNTVRGVLFYALAAFFVVCMGAFGKAMGDLGHHPIEIVFWRALGGLIIVSAYMLLSGEMELIKTTKHLAHFKRSILGNTGIFLFFWTVTLIPLVTATAILYISPIIVTVLSFFILKEKIGRHRWAAVFFGFMGTMILVQPSGESYSTLGVFVAFVNAFTVAGVSIALRDLGSSEHALTTSFYFFVYGTLATGFILPFVWTGLPELGWIFVGLILTGFLNQPLKTHAFRLADASAISPVQYFNIVWAAIIGYLVWQDVPTWNIAVGCAIVIASNMLILWRERRIKREHNS